MTAIGKIKLSQFPVFLLSAVLNDAKIIECNNSIQKILCKVKYKTVICTYVYCYYMNKYDVDVDLDNICIHNIDQVSSTI